MCTFHADPLGLPRERGFCVCRCLPCSLDHFCLEGDSEPAGECPSSSSIGFDCSDGILAILPGYWSPVVTNVSSGRLMANDTLQAYKCSSVASCVGGSVVGMQLVIPDVCAPGYEGDVCSGCQAGWASTGGGKCVRCHSSGIQVFSLIIVAGLVSFLIAALVAVATHNPRETVQVCVVR